MHLGGLPSAWNLGTLAFRSFDVYPLSVCDASNGKSRHLNTESKVGGRDSDIDDRGYFRNALDGPGTMQATASRSTNPVVFHGRMRPI